jgi:hypothetical protein
MRHLTKQIHSWVFLVSFSCSLCRPPLWSSGQSSWLQIRRQGFDSRHYQKKSSGSGTGSTQPREYNWGATWQKSSGSCLENREYGRRDSSSWPCGTLYLQKLAITSLTSGGRSVGIVRSRTQTMEFCLCLRDFSLELPVRSPNSSLVFRSALLDSRPEQRPNGINSISSLSSFPMLSKSSSMAQPFDDI